jgi:hypothetical protein
MNSGKNYDFICILTEILQSLMVHLLSEINLYIPYAVCVIWSIE